MDPLSISASVIALSQASGALGKGLKFFYSLRKIPDDFCNVVNELATLQAVLEQVKNALDEYGHGEPQASIPGLNTMKALEDDLKQALEELDSLCGRLQATGKVVETGGKLHISKQLWLRERGSIVKIRTRANTARERLTLCFGALISTQTSMQGRTILNIQRLLETTSVDTTRVLTINQAKQSSMQDIETSLSQIHSKFLDLENIIKKTTLEPPQPLAAVTKPEQPANTTLSNQMWLVQTTLERACSRHCSCRCHRHTQIQTPGWVRSVFGSLFVRYNSLPILDTRVCDSLSCQKRSAMSVQLRYIFPQWLLARAVCLAGSWDSLTGLGSDIHLRIPRVLQSNYAHFAVEQNDLAWIRKAISTKLIFPTDTDYHGETLLLAAVLNGVWSMTRLLLQQGFSTKGTDSDGWTVAKEAYKHLHAGFDRDSQTRLLLQKLSLCDNDGELPMSTLVHDSLLGLNRIPLASAIAQAPSDINRLDGIGWSPMHWAVWRGDSYSLKMMLAAPASNPHVRSADGRTLLQYISTVNPASFTEVTRLLIEAGVDINVADGRRYWYPAITTAFHSPALVQLLLEHGAKVTVEIHVDGEKPFLITPLLHFAVCEYNIQAHDSRRHNWGRSLKLLLRAGMDLDVPDMNGLTALHWSIVNRNKPLLQLLIQHGAKLDAVGCRERGILHLAALYADLDVIDILREAKIKGIRPEALSSSGWSPMQIKVSRMCTSENTELPPGVNVATHDEVLAFRVLLKEIRARNRSEQLAANTTSFETEYRYDDDSDLDVNRVSPSSDHCFDSASESGESEESKGSYQAPTADSEDLNHDRYSGSDEDEEASEEEFFDAVQNLNASSNGG